MGTFYTMEAVNLICADQSAATVQPDAQPGISTALELREMKLPGLEENMVDHLPGGAPVGIEIPTHINRLESTFSLAGWNPSVMTLIGQSQRQLQSFTAYGVIRDQRSGRPMKATAIIWGRLSRVNPTNWRRGDLHMHEYTIRAITHYELAMQLGANIGAVGGDEVAMTQIYYWDFFESALRVGGIDIKAAENLILGIAGGGGT